MSEIKVNKISPATGTDITLGDSGDTLTVPSGGTIVNSGTATGFGSSGYTHATQITTTSGTAHTFTGIPSGTTSIIMGLQGVSLSSNNDILYVTLGDAGGLETSGYLSVGIQTNTTSISNTVRHTAAFGLTTNDFDSTKNANGTIHLTLQDATTFTWTCASNLGNGWTGDAQLWVQGGSKSLSAELTQVSLTNSGTNTFDAGTVNIMYQ
jgi:hypothetical protein